MLFTRTSEEEAQVKCFVPHLGMKGNQQIADQLIWHAIVTAQRTRLPIHTFYPSSQRGTSFGERLANAIEDVFDMGYDQVITMGNDCPSLTAETLIDVRDRLYQSDLILGPTPDGGTYLIGLSKDAYHRERFIEMRWQTEWLLQDFEEYAETHSCELLDNQVDIDDAQTFKQVLKSIDPHSLLYKHLLTILFVSARQMHGMRDVIIQEVSAATRRLRAPPHA